MAKKWSEVIENPKYKALSDAEKENTRKAYFDDVVKPQIKPDQYDTVFGEFIADAYRMEGVKPQPVEQDMQWINTDTGLPERPRQGVKDSAVDIYRAAVAGMGNSYIGSKAKKLVNAVGLETPFLDTYKPETMTERIVSGVAGIGSDAPIFKAGGALLKGGKLAADAGKVKQIAQMVKESAGAFGLYSGMNSAKEMAERGDLETKPFFENASTALKETGKGVAVGAAVGVAGLPARGLQQILGEGVIPTIASKAVAIPTVSAGLLGAENIINDKPITKETILETLGTIAILDLLGALPNKSKTALDIAVNRGIPAEKIAENLKSEKVGTMQDEALGKEALDRAIVMTEKQIEMERIDRLQNEIVEKQVRANYKDGKAPEQIIQINQIPKEYRSVIMEQTEAGGWRYKPEVLQKVNDVVSGKDPIISAKLEDVLPGTIRDMIQKDGQKLADENMKLKTELEMAKTNKKHFEQQAPSLHESYMKEELANTLGDYRRFERSGAARDKMDQVIDHAMSVMTPIEKANVALEPSRLMDHIDIVESGYRDLKPAYREAVQKEIVAQLQMKTGQIPQGILENAQRVADVKTQKEAKIYDKELNNIDSAVKSVESNPEYLAHLQRNAPKSDFRILNETRPKLKDIDAEMEALKAQQRINWQKSMGESESFGDMSRDSQAYFGKDHFNDLAEFIVKTPEEISKVFGDGNFLPKEYKQRGASFNLFLNKSRLIANKLGEKVFRNFVQPIRQAEHNFTVEDANFKKWSKEYKSGWTKEERHEFGEYMISRDANGAETLAKMGRKPLTLDELAPKQKKAVEDFRKILDVIIERENAARAESGLDPIKKRDNYFTFMRDFTLMEELGFNPSAISEAQAQKIADHKTKSMSWKNAKDRIESTRALETDPFYVMEKYMTSALRSIHMTPIVGKLRSSLDYEGKFELKNPSAHKYLHDSLDYVSGKKISEADGMINAAANMINHNLGAFILTYSARTIAIQPTAVVNTIGLLGTRAVGKGLRDFSNKSMREFSMAKSKVLKSRLHDVTVEEMTKGWHGNIGKLKGAAADYGTLPLRYLDLKTAQITWLSAYRYFKDIGKREGFEVSDKDAIMFADDTVINSQGSAARIDLAPIQHTPLGKSLTLFNTFVINNLGFLTSDIAGIPKKYKQVAEGATKYEIGKYSEKNHITKLIKDAEGKPQYNSNGQEQYNVYESSRIQDPRNTRSAMEKMVALVAAGTIANTIFELGGGVMTNVLGTSPVNAPLPSPISAAYEGWTGQTWVDAFMGKEPTKKGDQLKGAIKATLQEFISVMPVVGGAFKYGGEGASGAVVSHIYDTINSLADQPGSKPLWYIGAKWAGIPGGQQIWKLVKHLSKERKEDEKDKKRAMHPVESMKREINKNNPYKQMRKEMNKQMRGY